jgi:hypothetical protein
MVRGGRTRMWTQPEGGYMGPPIQKITYLYNYIFLKTIRRGGPRCLPARGGQGRPPHQHQPFFIFRCVRKEMTVSMRWFGGRNRLPRRRRLKPVTAKIPSPLRGERAGVRGGFVG